MYGPRTGWENGYAQGEVSRVALVQSVTGYSGTYNYELHPASAEFGVPVKTGSKYEVIAGTAQSAYSYVYFKLFTDSNDQQAVQQNYFKVTPGMYLEWDQYNFQQTTMSLDFETLDGHQLRNDGCYDQYGINVHPVFRKLGSNSSAIGQWFHVKVSLDCMQGRVVKDWLIAYDNGGGGVGQTGQFRAYFDNIKVTVP
jgi:hypothetical protein